MTIQTVIKENAYFDSVTLMTISTRANDFRILVSLIPFSTGSQ